MMTVRFGVASSVESLVSYWETASVGQKADSMVDPLAQKMADEMAASKVVGLVCLSVD